jgi:hypothetical protein
MGTPKRPRTSAYGFSCQRVSHSGPKVGVHTRIATGSQKNNRSFKQEAPGTIASLASKKHKQLPLKPACSRQKAPVLETPGILNRQDALLLLWLADCDHLCGRVCDHETCKEAGVEISFQKHTSGEAASCVMQQERQQNIRDLPAPNNARFFRK